MLLKNNKHNTMHDYNDHSIGNLNSVVGQLKDTSTKKFCHDIFRKIKDWEII